MEWIDISLWCVVIVFIFSGGMKSAFRAMFLVLIFLMRSVNNTGYEKVGLDFIIIAIGLSIFLIYIMSRIYSKKKGV